MIQGIIFFISALIVCTAIYAKKKKHNERLNRFAAILTLTFSVVGFLRFFLSDSFVFVINGATYNGTYYEVTDVLQSVLRWGYYFNYAILPMAVFYDGRLFKNIASYVCLPFSVLSAIFFNDYMRYFLDPKGGGLHFAVWVRYAFFAVELILAISIPIVMQIRDRHVFRIKDKREWGIFLVTLPLIALLLIPPYIPQSLIGYSSMLAKIGSPFHIGWIAFCVLAAIVLYYLFRFKEKSKRNMLCVFLSLALFYHYNTIFLMGFSLSRLPVQLCNLAAYLYIIAIPFKRNKLFQFCYLANTMGAIIAIVAADFSGGGALSFWNMHFVYEHTLVFLVPILSLWLRIFPRFDRKALKYTFVGFTIYFVFCLISGTIINGYSDVLHTKVNYFFMFDLKKAFSYFPFLSFSENYMIKFGRFEIYPIVVSVIYVGFSALYLLFYFLTKFLYRYEDDRLNLRKSAIDLYEKITHKKSHRPLDFE